MSTLGFDVSVYQDPGSYSLDGLGFLIARRAYGTFLDRTYPAHIAAAKAAALVTGAYTFGRGAQDPEAQAATLLANAGDVDLLVLDVEADGAVAEMPEADCRAFYAYCKARDPRQVWLYHSRSGFPPDAYGFDGRWVADYGMNTGQPGKPPAIPWDLWQFTSNPIDTNRYEGTVDQLRARLGLEDPMACPIATETLFGYAATIGGPTAASQPTSVRVSPTFGAATIRTVTDLEPWTGIVAWVTGDANPADAGDTRWLEHVAGSGVREFVPHGDVVSLVPAPAPAAGKPTLDSTTSADGQSVTVTIKGG